MKTQILSIFAVFSLIALMTFAFAAGENMYIIDRTTCTTAGDVVVLGLTSNTNAHAEIASLGNYNTVLCANFGNGNFTCNGENTLIRLAANTNANVESPEENNFPVEVCYGGDMDWDVNAACSPTQVQAFSISGDGVEGDLHIGGFNDYPNKVCGDFNAAAGGPGEDSDSDIDDDAENDNDNSDNIKTIRTLEENFLSVNLFDLFRGNGDEETQESAQLLNVDEEGKKKFFSFEQFGIWLPLIFILLLILFVLLLVVAARKN